MPSESSPYVLWPLIPRELSQRPARFRELHHTAEDRRTHSDRHGRWKAPHRGEAEANSTRRHSQPWLLGNRAAKVPPPRRKAPPRALSPRVRPCRDPPAKATVVRTTRSRGSPPGSLTEAAVDARHGSAEPPAEWQREALRLHDLAPAREASPQERGLRGKKPASPGAARLQPG